MPSGDSPSRLAERLDHLFRNVHHPQQGKPYTYREAAEAINHAAGRRLISPSYLMYLRHGQRGQRISRTKLHAIADFFGVPADYFDDPATAQRINNQLDAIAALREAGVRAIAVHAAGLPADMLDAILAITIAARTTAGLTPPAATSTDEAPAVPAPRTAAGTDRASRSEEPGAPVD